MTLSAPIFPRLNKYSPDKQHDSILEYQESGNAEDLEYLFRSTQGMVYFLAKRYQRMGREVPAEDLVQVGLLALLEACRNFDSTRGLPFTAMAWRYIQTAMLLEIRKFSSPFSGNPRARRQIVRDARHVEAHLMQKGVEPTASRVAKELGVDESLCAHVLGRDPGVNAAVCEPSVNTPPRDILALEKVQRVLNVVQFSPQEQEVLNRRLLTGDPDKLEAIAATLGITRQGAHLIEKRILQKIRRALKYVD
jgi:RNA polymerase sigma factor for flagellar operon FliA